MSVNTDADGSLTGIPMRHIAMNFEIGECPSLAQSCRVETSPTTSAFGGKADSFSTRRKGLEMTHCGHFSLKKGGQAVEERARNDLGMVKDDEVYYRIIEKKKSRA